MVENMEWSQGLGGVALRARIHHDIQEIAMTLNLTPRKCLQFRSLVEAFLAELGNDIEIRFNGRVALRG